LCSEPHLRASLIAPSLASAPLLARKTRSRPDSLDRRCARPIAASLKEDQEILQALRMDSASEKDSGILASYLAKIRADGLPKQADVKQKLDRLAENNSAIVALINVYSLHTKTATFRAEADKFTRYAIAWRDRWNSVMELFMAGGNYPVAEVPFPTEFIAVVQTEIEAAMHVL